MRVGIYANFPLFLSSLTQIISNGFRNIFHEIAFNGNPDVS